MSKCAWNWFYILDNRIYETHWTTCTMLEFLRFGERWGVFVFKNDEEDIRQSLTELFSWMRCHCTAGSFSRIINSVIAATICLFFFPSDLVGIIDPGFLVHRVSGEEQPILYMDFQWPTQCFLDDWFLQSSGLSHSNETGSHARAQGLGLGLCSIAQWCHQGNEGRHKFPSIGGFR